MGYVGEFGAVTTVKSNWIDNWLRCADCGLTTSRPPGAESICAWCGGVLKPVPPGESLKAGKQ